jgi:YfiR/HmsC-like
MLLKAIAAVRVLAAALWLCGVVSAAPAQAASSVKEAQIKAAFLYNFTKFIEWPQASFAPLTDTFVVGLFGDSSLQQVLERTVKDRRVNGRSIVVRRVVTPEEVQAVHLLFVEASEEARFADVWQRIAGSTVLLVGESPSFLGSGGCIRLILDEQRLRFEINASAAERARLRISSQLQKLAVAVHHLP